MQPVPDRMQRLCAVPGTCLAICVGVCVAVCLSMCLTARARAQPIPYVYPFNVMTAQEVIDQRLRKPRSQLDYINREKVEAYLNGIKDGAHGSAWCLNRAVLPHELNLAIVQRLKQTRKPAELKANAAPLVVAELRRRFPCEKPGKGKGKR